MGVAIYIQGYEKVESTISGEIKILGWYEVMTNEIEKYKIKDAFTVIHNELRSIKYVMEKFWQYGFEDSAELTFYFNIMNSMTGGGYRYENDITYGIMFDGQRLLSIIQKIFNHIDRIPLGATQKEEEKENLTAMHKVISVIAENNGIVGIMIG